MNKKDMLLFVKLTLEDAICSSISRDGTDNYERATLEKARAWTKRLMELEKEDKYAEQYKSYHITVPLNKRECEEIIHASSNSGSGFDWVFPAKEDKYVKIHVEIVPEQRYVKELYERKRG